MVVRIIAVLLFFLALSMTAGANAGGAGGTTPAAPVTPLRTDEEIAEELARKLAQPIPLPPEERKRLREEFEKSFRELQRLVERDGMGAERTESGDEPEQSSEINGEELLKELDLLLKEEAGTLTPKEKAELDKSRQAEEEKQKQRQKQKAENRRKYLHNLGWSDKDIELFDGKPARQLESMLLDEKFHDLGTHPSEGARKAYDEAKKKLSYTPAEEKRLAELEESLRKNNSSAPPPPAPVASMPRMQEQGSGVFCTASLESASRSLLSLRLSGDGKDTKSPDLLIRNNTIFPCLLRLPAGTFLVPSDPKFQTMLMLEPAFMAVAGKSEGRFPIHTVCADNKTLLPPLNQSASGKASISYVCAKHPNAEMGKFASACRQTVERMVKKNAFVGNALLENDSATAVQMTIWSESGSRTQTKDDDLNEASVSADLHSVLSEKLGRTLEMKEKEQLKPSIVEMLKTVNLCQKITHAQMESKLNEATPPATAQFVLPGATSK